CAAHGVALMVQHGLGYTPTPVVSHAILTYNRGRTGALADGVVITPSHNPPEDGGIKYNPPAGGPADTQTTKAIEERANALLADQGAPLSVGFERAMRAATPHRHDYVRPYVDDLASVVDLEAIARAGLRLGVDPMGGANVAFWDPIAERYGLDLTVVNRTVDPTFAFMTVDKDGRIRTDCSSPWAMAGLIALTDRSDVASRTAAHSRRPGTVPRR